MTFAAGKLRAGAADRRPAGRRPLAACGAPAWILILLVVLLGAYLASGFYVVAADERAVVRRFGAVAAQIGPGMHYALPWPVNRVDVVKTTSVMKVGVGFSLPAAESEAPSGMELLSGDANILNAALVLQYVIRDPAEFLFQIEDPQVFVEAVAEQALTETVLGMPIDEVLTRGRVAVQERVKAETQQILDRRRSGIQIVSASIMTMTLDRSVAQAFQDVADAMADREKMINEARAYESNLIPKARGEARTRLAEAEAYKQQRISEAIGETGRFLALRKEYEKVPGRHPDPTVSGSHGADPSQSAALRDRTRTRGGCRCT